MPSNLSLALLWEQCSRCSSVLRYIDDTRLSHKLVWVFLTVLYETQMVQYDTGWFGIHNFNQISQYQLIFTISTNFHNFNQILRFQPDFTISTNFHNFSQCSQYQPIFIISTYFHNFNQLSQFQPIVTISTNFFNFTI